MDPQMNTIEAFIQRQRLRRKVQGIAAALLPYDSNGEIAVEAFQRHLAATQKAGLMNAVNMDTGYVNLLTQEQKHSVLGWTRDALGKDVSFVAGAYVEEQKGDLVSLYRRELDIIVESGAVPIIFQT